LFRPLRQSSAANLWESVGLICSLAAVPKLFLPHRQYRARESMGKADGLARSPGEELHKLCLRLRRSTAENLSQLDAVIC
jgi:type III secretory pathway lipoprotein EscJ